MGMLDDFDAMISTLSVEDEQSETIVGQNCVFCDSPGQVMLKHDDNGCELACCRSCGSHVMAQVQEIIDIDDGDVEVLKEALRALFGPEYICRFCHEPIDLHTARIEEPDR